MNTDQLKAEIIAIGTELLLGQIANTNAQFISEQLAQIGIPVYYHTVVGDNAQRLTDQIHISRRRSNVIIFTGGLGPTQDDLTKETIANIVGKSLEVDEGAIQNIEKHFIGRQQTMTENNRKQALVIEGAEVFANTNGLAPGMAVRDNETVFLLFPGPPKELKPMFTEKAIPYLSQLLPEQRIVYSRVMCFCGIGESRLETELVDIIDQQSNPTIAPLAKDGEVVLRLTSFADSVDEAERMMAKTIKTVRSRVGTYHYGWDNDTLESVVTEKLKQAQLTIATAESCTAGLLAHMISKSPGASRIFPGGTVCYSTESKRLLGISESLLESKGAVSAETAEQLAEAIRRVHQADIGVSITGVAGPEKQENKPVGTVYIGLACADRLHHVPLQLAGKRDDIQVRATKLALYHLYRFLKDAVEREQQ